MQSPFDAVSWQEAAVLLLIAALGFALYPLFSWWSAQQAPWYLSYLLWALIILLAFIVERRFHSHDA